MYTIIHHTCIKSHDVPQRIKENFEKREVIEQGMDNFLELFLIAAPLNKLKFYNTYTTV